MGQIGDDLDADLGEGTWQLGLRRILGECGAWYVLMLCTIAYLTQNLTVDHGASHPAVRTGKFSEGDDKRGERPADETHDTFAAWVQQFISIELNGGH